MSKHKQKHKGSTKVSPAISSRNSLQKKAKHRIRTIRRSVMVLVVLVMAGGAGFTAFKNNYDIAHDLSVIGQGVPTVVQIHDTKCPLCLRLRSDANSAMVRFSDEDLLFFVADVTTPEDQGLMRKYNVSKVTLLLFDRDGKLNRSLNGVKSDDVLHQAFLAHISRRANRLQLKTEPDDARIDRLETYRDRTKANKTKSN
jgi:hypothetical protein